MFDPHTLRRDFPLLKRKINGKPLVYLDSTATSLKPQSVLDKIHDYYAKYTANVFRGIYKTTEEATAEYEDARKKVARFINAQSNEVIFTRGTTESINLVAYSLRPREVVTSVMEHHSNFVPWQQLSKIKVWDTEKPLDTVITRTTRLFAITAVSNVTGLINPIKTLVQTVKLISPNCVVLVDAAQAVPHMRVDVVDWGADFVAFSGHKMLGPTGIGVLWAKKELLERMNPFNYGGDMISEVHLKETIFKGPPHKFEAGTPHIAGVIGLGAAVDYLSTLGMKDVRAHEKEITDYALSQLRHLSNLKIIGPKKAEEQGGVIAFTMKGVHPHDIAQVLDEDNVCIRVGFHCAQPFHEYLGIGPTARASFYVYTTKEDVDALIVGLQKVTTMFR